MSRSAPSLSQTTLQKQTQHLMALPQMQQAFELMQMPLLELASLVELQIEQNPLLTTEDFEEGEELESQGDEELEILFDENDFSHLKEFEEELEGGLDHNSHKEYQQPSDQGPNKLEQYIEAVPTLFQYLMAQAHETFETKEELAIAQTILGNLTAEGYFTTPLEEIQREHSISLKTLNGILSKIKTFEPHGIAAGNLQEAFLLQLQALNKESGLAFAIVADHFDDLLHNRMAKIQKSLNCSFEELDRAIQSDIAHLSFHPATDYEKSVIEPIIPDVTLYEEAGELVIQVNDDYLPTIRLREGYLQMMQNPKENPEVKEFLHHQLNAGKWLLRNIAERNKTLERLTRVLATKQKNFFLSPHGTLLPMTMKNVADELNLNESTITRAVANKYLESPRGILPLRSFFSVGYSTKEGKEISAHTIRERLSQMIAKEKRGETLSDAKLSRLLEEQGIHCARRTIAKYRASLKIGNKQQRKRF